MKVCSEIDPSVIGMRVWATEGDAAAHEGGDYSSNADGNTERFGAMSKKKDQNGTDQRGKQDKPG